MTSKERVKAAVRHQMPDHIPVGERDWASGAFVEELLGHKTCFGGMISYNALWEGRWQEYMDSMVRDLPDLLQRLAWDIVTVWPNIGRDTPIERLELIDADKKLYRDSAGNILQYTEEVDRIMIIEESGRATQNEYLAAMADKDTLPSEQIVRDTMLKRFGATHYIIGAYSSKAHPTLGYSSAVGLEPWIMRIYEEPEKWFEESMNGMAVYEDCVSGAAKLGFDAYADACDLGYSGGPFIRTELFEKWMYPVFKRHWKIIHKHGMDVFFHQCGDNRLLMDMIVDAGVDIVQSIQPEEHIEELKAKYGSKITLMGGVSFKSLILGTPEDVRRETLWALDTCAPGGGFILASQHSLPRGLKVRNYLAMLDAKAEWEKFNLK